MHGLNCRGGSSYVQIETADYRRMLLGWAKAELLKEKVKAKLDKKYGKEIDGIAETLVEVMVKDQETRKEQTKKKDDVRNKLQSFFEDGAVV